MIDIESTILIVLLVGAAGGAARSILGYFSVSDDGEAFDFKKLGKSILRAAFGGAVLAYSLLNTADLPTIFLAAFSADVATKSVWDIITDRLSTKQTTDGATPPPGM